MRPQFKTMTFGLYVLSAVAVLAGFYLIANDNIETRYASAVPTATQTVKVCHNHCRYLTPQIAFRLYLGFGLAIAGWLTVTALSIGAKLKRRP